MPEIRSLQHSSIYRGKCVTLVLSQATWQLHAYLGNDPVLVCSLAFALPCTSEKHVYMAMIDAWWLEVVTSKTRMA